MDYWTRLFWLPFGSSLGISLLVTTLTILIFRHFGWVVDPKKINHPAHTHKESVPKGGGIPLLISVATIALLYLPLDKHLIAILVALTLTVVVGVVDDVKPISPKIRLFVNLLSALVVVGAGIGIAFVTNPFGQGVIDLSHPRISFNLWGVHEIWLLPDLFALIWIPFVMNAVNWSSGIDGQASGMLAIAAMVIGLLSLNYSADITQWNVAILAFALAGAMLGIAIFHFYPQQIMPGYGATTGAGLLLAVLAILSTTKIGTSLMVLGVPLLDAVYTIGRRIISKKSPLLGDRGHLHHKLLDLGWGKRRISVFYWITTAVLGLIALKLNAGLKIFAILCLAAVMAGMFLWIYFGGFLKRYARGNG